MVYNSGIMAEKYLIVYKMKGNTLLENAECHEYEGTKQEAIQDAIESNRHLNYDRCGVLIYKVEEPVFVLDTPKWLMSKWENISTAPKDGSLVLAWRHDWERPDWVRWRFNYRTETTFWNNDGEDDSYENQTEPPTHWIRLPALPEESQ